MEILTKEIIESACELYIQGNSISETTKLINTRYRINVCPAAIGKRLRKISFKLRSSKEGTIIRTRKHINISKLLEEYNNKIPIRRLSRDLKIARSTIKKILKENKVEIKSSRSALLAIGYIKEKEKFNLSVREKAYLYGLVLGDLTPVRKSNYTIKLITHSTHKIFMGLLQRTFEKYGPTNYKLTKNLNMFRFQSHVDLESFSFLLNSKQENIPEWINEENFFDFLAGFIDSDGSVMLKRAGKNIFYSIRFFGQNLNLLEQIKERLRDLGFTSSITLSHKKGDTRYHNGTMFRYNKDYYILETRKIHTVELLKKIPIRHPEKIMKRKLIFRIQAQNTNKWNEVEDEVDKVRKLIKESII